jgi:hypothetical protein
MSGEAEKIAQQWLDDVSFSAATWNLDAHMQLVSRQVLVTGIPHIDSIDYDGWKQRRRNEFDNKLLRSLTYQLYKIISASDEQLRFAVEETMRGNNGKTLVIDKQVTLGKEDDGKWRVQQERVDFIRSR